MTKIAKDKGATKLWAGLNAAYLRAFIFHGLKLPIYENFKYFICTPQEIIDTPLNKKIISGVASGAIAIVFATPAEIIKVKMQAQARGNATTNFTGNLNCAKFVMSS